MLHFWKLVCAVLIVTDDLIALYLLSESTDVEIDAMGKLDTPLCLYRYDALDELVGLTPALQANTRRFYAQDKLATEIRGQGKSHNHSAR